MLIFCISLSNFIKLDIQIVYEARAVPAMTGEAQNALAAGQIDAVLHFSRRSAAVFTGLVVDSGLADIAGTIRHICISSDAAGALEPLQPRHLEVAVLPDTKSLLQCLQQ